MWVDFWFLLFVSCFALSFLEGWGCVFPLVFKLGDIILASLYLWGDFFVFVLCLVLGLSMFLSFFWGFRTCVGRGGGVWWLSFYVIVFWRGSRWWMCYFICFVLARLYRFELGGFGRCEVVFGLFCFWVFLLYMIVFFFTCLVFYSLCLRVFPWWAVSEHELGFKFRDMFFVVMWFFRDFLLFVFWVYSIWSLT